MMNGCTVCASSSNKPIYAGILRCENCGHVFCDLHLNDKQLFEFYSKNYFFGDEYSNYLDDRKVLQKNFKLRLKVLQQFLETGRHKHLLEIGCAYGFFLDIVREQFDTVQGIDITEDGIRYAREQLKLNVINVNFLKHDFAGRKFDLVCLWDTIEHLRNPHLYLKKINNHMKSGALLAITTGDIESLNARLRKNKWRLMHPPTHIHYFSRKTLSKILDNYGFDIIYNRYCGFYRSIDNAAYRTLVLNKKQSKFYNFLRKSGLGRIDLYLNLYDIMYVIGRRR